MVFSILILWPAECVCRLIYTIDKDTANVMQDFITGSVNGQFIVSMKKLAQEIIPLALNNQFQEPKITNIISLEFENDIETSTQQHAECPKDSVYITRPSDFRIRSICDDRNVEFDDHLVHNVDETANHKHDMQKKRKTAPTPKSMRKLFDEFIAEFNASVERYCYLNAQTTVFGLHIPISCEFSHSTHFIKCQRRICRF